MRTTNNTNNYTVENLVAKYRNFVKENTPMEIAFCDGEDFEVPSSDIDASSDQQLIVTLYRSVAEKNANKEVLDVLSDYSEHFYKDVLNDDEFTFLCEHFSEVIEYEFTHRTDWHCPYIHMRREAIKDGKVIEDAGRLYKAFNDTSISDEDFVKALVQADKRQLTRLRRKVNELWEKMP